MDSLLKPRDCFALMMLLLAGKAGVPLADGPRIVQVPAAEALATETPMTEPLITETVPTAPATHELCLAAIASARSLLESVPVGDPTRIFAASDLHQAMVEDANGEFDDCLELADRALLEIRERRHVLRPGESLDGLGIRQ